MSRTLYMVTQENLIENSVQDCLSYILKLHSIISRKCGQTLGLGLGQIRYSSSIIISLQ